MKTMANKYIYTYFHTRPLFLFCRCNIFLSQVRKTFIAGVVFQYRRRDVLRHLQVSHTSLAQGRRIRNSIPHPASVPIPYYPIPQPFF